MFEAASTLEDDEIYRELLEGQGWTVSAKSKLFTQINHSDIMNEFLELAFSRTQGSLFPG